MPRNADARRSRGSSAALVSAIFIIGNSDRLKTLPDAYQILGRQGLYGDYFSFYLCDVVLKLNGKGGQPTAPGQPPTPGTGNGGGKGPGKPRH